MTKLVPVNADSSNLDFTIREFDGHQIRQRKSDGYFDATALCRVSGKELRRWLELVATKSYLSRLQDVVSPRRATIDPVLEFN